MKLRCLIIDDEPNAVALLASYVEQVPFLELRQSCYHAFEALTFLKQEPVDLIFLDINMPGISGIDMIDMLPPTSHFVFTTAYSQYAVESYEKNAVDYLLKPITFKRFMQAVTKVMDKTGVPTGAATYPVSNVTDFAFIKSGKQLVRIEYASVLFFEGLKEYIKVVSKTGNIIVYKRMKDLEQELPNSFLRIHHSYIINLQHIQKIESNHVWIGDKHLPVSDKYRNEFLLKINQKLL